MIPDDDREPDALLRAVVSELKRPVPLRPDLASRVLAEARRSPRARFLAWTVRPRTITVSPLAGLAAAAAVVATVVLGRPRAPAPVAASPRVEFVLFAPTATAVTLVGDFNDWDASATPLTPSHQRAGTWTVDIPIPPGPHEYAFLVDGTRWTVDPAAPRGPDTGFGSSNSILTVTGS